MSSVPRLHVLGCGRAASALARRLLDTGLLRPGLVVNRSLESARRAVAFIGAGQAAENLDRRVAGGWLMLGLPDGVLDTTLPALLTQLPAAPALAFHLSGSVEASVLRSAATAVAAVHPVRAFSDPGYACEHFAGTWCVAEGDERALSSLCPVFEAAGGRWLAFHARDKAAWHAATVAASNFLVTIQALARQLADRAGLTEAQSAEVLCDLQQGTLDLLRQGSPRQVLTGPIERGDEAACRRLMSPVSGLEVEQARLFSALGRATLDLARTKRGGRAGDASIEAMFSLTSD